METFNPEAIGRLTGIAFLVIAAILVLRAHNRKAKRKKEEDEIE
jgi:hypothetical protein